MEVYRISKCTYIQDINGTGAKMHGGRWNSKGHSVLYTTGSRSLAVLEALVHIPQKNLTNDFCLALIHIPDDLQLKTLSTKKLPKGWRTIPIQSSLQRMGDRWLKSGECSILKVPSVIIPEEWNFLINPMHPDASKIKIKKTVPFVFDERLEKG